MIELTPTSFAVLAGAGFLAGFVDSIAGGGGIITVPALLAVGLPPHLALGTNKLQSSFGSLTAAIHYSSKGLVALRETLLGVALTAIGAAAGTIVIQRISPGMLRHAVPALLVAVFIYMLRSRTITEDDRAARLGRACFYSLFGLTIGFYDGFFGPGTGSFWAVAFVALLGLGLKSATAHTKVMNFTSNVVSLFFFILGGNVVFAAGLVMGGCEVAGALLGSRLVIVRGARFVRTFYLCVVAATLARLVFVTYFR